MNKYDFYTGGPAFEGPPTNSSELSQQEIVQNANLTGYDIDPNQRLFQIQNQSMFYSPGSYGYNQPFSGFMNPPQPSGFQGFAGNPAFQYMQNVGMQSPLTGYQNPYMQPQYQDYTYFVPGFNTGTKLLLPSDAEEKCQKLQMEMMMEQEEAYIERLEKQKQYYSSLGFSNPNYYGMPYAFSYYNDPAITNKYKQIIEDMKRQAEIARNDLNKKLSRLSQNYIYGEVDEKAIEEAYKGHYITIPGIQIHNNQEQARLSNMVPIDTSVVYQQHNAAVSAAHNKFFSENDDMNTFFGNCGEMIMEDHLEEERHRRRDGSGLYQQDGAYKMLIRKKLREKHAAQNGGGINLPQLGAQPNLPIGGFPTLQQSAKLLDDGTLQISAPSWLGNNQYVVKNAMEDDYEKNRSKFVQSIFLTNPTPGGNPNGSR